MKYFNLPKWQLIALPITLIMLSVFFYAKYYVADELIFARYQARALESDLLTALARIEEEEMRTAVAAREADVAQQANSLLRESERQRQDEIARLQADLAFYRRLGGATGSQAPLAVHHLELRNTRSPNVYRLVLTLTQNLRWASVISGRIELSLEGIRDNRAEHFDEQQLLAESSDDLTFQFKYFQQIERLINIPGDLEPSRLTVSLKSNSLRSPIEQAVEWDDLFSSSEEQTVQ